MSATLVVRVTRCHPFESADPERPGVVHAVLAGGALMVSKEALLELRRLSDKGHDEFDRRIDALLRGLTPTS